MELWAKYLISDENYDDWGDPIRYFEGVYTSKAVEEDKNTYYRQGHKQCEKVLKALNEKLSNLITNQTSFTSQMNELLEDKFNTKKKRKSLQKEIEKLGWEIKKVKKDIQEYEQGITNVEFCINIGLKCNGVVYKKVEIFVTDYEREILERFCF